MNENIFHPAIIEHIPIHHVDKFFYTGSEFTIFRNLLDPVDNLTEAVVIGEFPINDRSFRYVNQSGGRLQKPFIKSVFDSMLQNGDSIETISEIMIKDQYRLRDVACLRNAQLTRAFLKTKNSMHKKGNAHDRKTWIDRFESLCEDISDAGDPLIYHYPLMGADIRDSVHQAMNSLNLQDMEDYCLQHFFNKFGSVAATESQNIKVLKVLIDQIIRWNILNLHGSVLIEQEVFNKANKDALKILLQYRLDYHIEKSFGNNALAALFGNPNVKIGALKRKKQFKVNATGFKGFTALHYAMKNKHFKKVKYLLDRGAEPNAMTRSNITPLTLAVWQPQVNPNKNEKCAELLLQYGADPFLQSNRCVAFNRCILARHALSGNAESLYAELGYLTELALSYICIHEANGVRNHSKHGYIMGRIDEVLREDDYLFNLYARCQLELKMLKEHEIRKNLTMLTVLCNTGEHLIRLVNQEDYKIINSYIDIYCKEMMLHHYYLNALREHMRQFRKLVAHKNRAIQVITTNAKALEPYSLVLEKIVSYFSYSDLLLFQ